MCSENHANSVELIKTAFNLVYMCVSIMFPFFALQFIMGFESTYQWEDPIYSGAVFGVVLVTLVSICYYSLISVLAYVSLTVLMAVIGIKIYTYIMVTFLKKETVNPIAKFAGNYSLIITNYTKVTSAKNASFS